MREHFEVLNHKKAFDFIKKLSKNSWKEVFNEKNILKIHELILANINDDFA
jgi:Fic family protein